MSTNEIKKNPFFTTSFDDREIRRIKHNLSLLNTTICKMLSSHTVKLLQSLPFLRYCGDKVYCHGIGNGQTELFNENKNNYLFNICQSHISVYQAY